MNKTWSFAFGALAVGVFVGWLGGRTSSSSKVGATNVATVWTCSMHPQIKQPKKGKCPICAMDLIPAGSAGRQTGPRQLAMSPAAKALAKIETTKVVRKIPEAEIRLVGKVAFDETRNRTIAARFPGRIDRLYVDFTGIAVRKGDHLAKIYSPELLTAQSELISAKRLGGRALSAARDKLKLWGLQDSQVAQVEASGKTTDQMDIDSPLGGVVTKKMVSEGSYVKTGAALFEIADLSRVWVQLEAYESDLSWLRFGQDVEFTAKGVPGKTFRGKIAFIDPQLNTYTRTVRIRVNAENVDALLKPGMFVSSIVKARIAAEGRVLAPELAGKWISPMHPEVMSDEPGRCTICGMELVKAEDLGYGAITDTEKALVVPRSAVLQTGKRSIVYVEVPNKEGPLYEAREVVLGARATDDYLVEAGLREGEFVVTEGAFKIDSSLQIQGKPSMMSERVEWDVTQGDWTQILDHYLRLQVALSKDDLPTAQQSINGLDQIASVAANETLLEAITEIAETNEIELARKAFETVSNLMISVSNLGFESKGKLFEAHCSMAFDNEGASWLQTEERVINPYFGSRMYRCGTLTREVSLE